MAHKRTAREAFGGQVSAFAAARQAKQPQSEQPQQVAPSGVAQPYDSLYNAEQPSRAATPRPSIQLSSIAKDAIVEDGDASEVTLQARQSVTFIGEYELSVLKGRVSIYGCLLHPGSGVRQVYALSSGALAPIISLRDDTAIRVKSTPFKSRISRLEKCSPLFRGLSAIDMNRSFTYLPSSTDDPLQRSLAPLEIDEDTKKILSRISARLEANEALRIMVVGPKSSGKSTFNRLLCNLITSKPEGKPCLYLDTDPGQPEFGPPGQISLVEVNASLLGPSFTHTASVQSRKFRLIRSHTLAAVSFKDDPQLYVSCVVDLANHAPKHLPLVVNACGWVSGVGADIILELTSRLSLTDVPLVHPVDEILERQLATKLNVHHVRRKVTRTAMKAPAELRAMQTMAYFHSRFDGRGGALRWSDKNIDEKRPWIVDYIGQAPGIRAILSYDQMPHPDFLAEVLDGSVVAIVVLEPEHAELDSAEHTDMEGLPYISSHAEQGSSRVDPKHSRCIGLALIRAIDVEQKKLHLLTSLPSSQIEDLQDQKIVLIRGAFDSPNWAYLQGVHLDSSNTFLSGEERPWVSRSEPVGIEGSVWRLRHPPMAADVRNAS